MPAKPAPIKKSPAKKAAETPAKAPEEPAPAPAPAEAAPAEAAPATPAEGTPAEAPPAVEAPAVEEETPAPNLEPEAVPVDVTAPAVEETPAPNNESEADKVDATAPAVIEETPAPSLEPEAIPADATAPAVIEETPAPSLEPEAVPVDATAPAVEESPAPSNETEADKVDATAPAVVEETPAPSHEPEAVPVDATVPAVEETPAPSNETETEAVKVDATAPAVVEETPAPSHEPEAVAVDATAPAVEDSPAPSHETEPVKVDAAAAAAEETPAQHEIEAINVDADAPAAEDTAAPTAAPEGIASAADAPIADDVAATPAAEDSAAPTATPEGIASALDAPIAEDVTPAPTEEGAAPAPDAPADAAAAAAPAADDSAAPQGADAPADAAPAEAAPVEEPPKAPTPPPAEAPTSAPLDVAVEDVNDNSLTITWTTPENIGAAGLDGYTVEYCKEGTSDWVAANEQLTNANCLTIKHLTTGDLLCVRVVAVNPAGRSEPGALAAAVPIREMPDRPRIRMPRSLRTRIVKHVGEQVNLTIPFLGSPKADQVTWLKNGQPVDTKRILIRNTDKNTIFFIRTATKDDSGVYELTVKVDSFEDKAKITLQIVELPGPPASIKLMDCWGFNAALEWTAPKENGNTEITGYTVQKADKKTGDWFTVLDHYHRLTATVSDLVMGNSYSFRVFSQNKVGRSEECAVTKDLANVQKTVIVYNPPEYKERDYTEPPKFTTPLNDRATTVGYTAKLLCSVRGYPMPKVEWLRNHLVIGDDAKFRQVSKQGVCSLEIRKPSNFDGGVYSCRAKNAHGDATVSCRLEVKQITLQEEKGQ